MDKFVKIEIPYKSNIASVVLSYAASFPGITSFRCENLKNLRKKKELDLEISFGETKINYEDEELIFVLERIGNPVGLYFSAEIFEIFTIKIKYNDDSEIEAKKKVIDDLLKSAIEYSSKKDSDEIICKILKNGNWRELTRLPKRSLDTIYLPKNKKENIYNDLKNFFELEDEYKKLGIPWKRNYLLEGPPGTGKTSLIFALASCFNLDIYIINLGPSVDDSVFMSSVANLPNKTILLLEDIDALFVERKANDGNKSLVSFSGILNVLDGMARKTGLITFMTTNYKENLDKALIRPSRIDFMMNFTDCEESEIKLMFDKFFPDRKKDFKKFYKKIKSFNLRMCILQQFFMECRFNNKDIFDINRLKNILDEMDNTKKPEGNIYL